MYIDLYAGAGYSRIKGTKRILKGSPILALTVTNPFDKYILCEESEESLAALNDIIVEFFIDATVGAR